MKFKLIKDIIANSTFEDVLLYEKGTIFIQMKMGYLSLKVWMVILNIKQKKIY